MRVRRYALTVLGFFLLQSTIYAAPSRWLHVQVEEAGNGEKINLNVPLSLVETVLPLVPAKHRNIDLSREGIKVSDLRNMWAALRAQGDGTLAEVETGEMKLRVFIENDFLRVRSDETSEHKIDVNVPGRIVDALLSGQGEELNIEAAVNALKELDNQEIVSIQDKDNKVRIWIDDRW